MVAANLAEGAVRDKADSRTSRPAATCAARRSSPAGALLLGATFAAAWTPGRCRRRSRRRCWSSASTCWRCAARRAGRRRRPGIGHFESHLDPVFVTDLDGRPLARNPAARGGDPLAAATAEPRRALPPDPRGAAERRRRRAGGGRPADRRHPPRPPHAALALEPAPSPAAARRLAAHAGVPWLRLDADRRCSTRTPPPRRSPAAPRTRDARRPAAASRRDPRARPRWPSGAGGGRPAPTGGATCCWCRSTAPRSRASCPTTSSTSCRWRSPASHRRAASPTPTRAARQLLGERARPGVNLADLIEGLGRPIAERLADTTWGAPRPLRDRPRHRRRPGDVPAGRLHPHRARWPAVAARRPLRRDRARRPSRRSSSRARRCRRSARLAGGVAHDFNNLLTAINGYCDLLLVRHEVADVEHGDLMQIRQNANRAAASPPAARLLPQADAAPAPSSTSTSRDRATC